MAEVVSQVVSQRITNKLTRLHAAVNKVANREVVTSDDIQYFINCLEHFHRHLRLSQRGFVTVHSLRILQDALSSLRDSGMPEDSIGLFTVFNAILKGWQSGQELQCLHGNPIANNFFQNRPFSKMAAKNSNTLEYAKIKNEYQH